MAKIHINISAGIFEAEGEPVFVREIYEDFKKDLSRLSQKDFIKDGGLQLANQHRSDVINIDVQDSSAEVGSAKKKSPKKSGAKESYKLQSIKTGLPNQQDSIFSYLERYKPQSNIEKNTVFVKYLQDQHPAIKISLDHIYTCYSNSDQKPASALQASVRDTSRVSKGYGYIDISDTENICVSQKGELLLHQLKQNAQKK